MPSLLRAQAVHLTNLLQMVSDYHLYDHLDFDPALTGALLGQVMENDTLGRLWLIQYQEETIGYLLLTFCFSLEYQGRNAFIDEFFLKAPWRGKGIGARVLSLVKTEAHAAGVSALHLEVVRKNLNAVKLYERAGFQDNDRFLMTHWLNR